MNITHFNQLKRNKALKKRLAKFIAYSCFRNSKLENLHGGMGPSSKIGDYSDVKVVSPYGEISWREASRLNDAEMKTLMIDVVNRCYNFVCALFSSSRGDDLIELLKRMDWKSDWQDPTGLVD